MTATVNETCDQFAGYSAKLITNYMLDDVRQKFNLKPSSFVLLSFIARSAYKKGKIWWSVKKIAEACNLSTRTIQRSLNLLNDLEFIQIFRQPGNVNEIFIAAETLDQAHKGKIKPPTVNVPQQAISAQPEPAQIVEFVLKETSCEKAVTAAQQGKKVIELSMCSLIFDESEIAVALNKLEEVVAKESTSKPSHFPRIIEIEDEGIEESKELPLLESDRAHPIAIEIEIADEDDEVVVSPVEIPIVEEPEPAHVHIQEEITTPIAEETVTGVTRPPLLCLKQLEGDPDSSCFFYEGRVFKRTNAPVSPNWLEKVPFILPEGPWAVSPHQLDPGFWEWKATTWAKEQCASVTLKKAEFLNQIDRGGKQYAMREWVLYTAFAETELNSAVNAYFKSEDYQKMASAIFKRDLEGVKFQHLQVVKYGRVLKNNPQWQTYLSKCWSGWQDASDPDKGVKKAIAQVYKLQALSDAIEVTGVWPRLPDEEQVKLNAHFNHDAEYINHLEAKAQAERDKAELGRKKIAELKQKMSDPDWHMWKDNWCKKFPDQKWEDRFTFEHPHNVFFGKKKVERTKPLPLDIFQAPTDGLDPLEKFFARSML